MIKEEKAKKLLDANKDLNKGKDILNNFNFKKYKSAKNYVDDCCKNQEYAPFILVNRIGDGLFGDIEFLDLDPLRKRKVLNMIVKSIEEYIANISLEKEE